MFKLRLVAEEKIIASSSYASFITFDSSSRLLFETSSRPVLERQPIYYFILKSYNIRFTLVRVEAEKTVR